MCREELKTVYISYARGADYSLIERLVEKNKELNNRWQIVYDQQRLQPGDSIIAFEKELAGADKVLILLSKKYFQSVDCMRELKSLYQKGANKLLPVIVFVGGNGLGDIDDESEIIEYWQAESRNRKEKGDNTAAKKCAETANQLPVLFAWLFGEVDKEADRYDTIFSVIKKGDNDCDDIFTALEREEKLRYTFLSGVQKRELVKRKINKAMWRVPAGVATGYLEDLATELDCTKDEVASFLVKASDSKHIKTILDCFDIWLKDLAVSAEPSRELVVLAKKVKEMLGWFLLMAFDDKQLHMLTHRLNRKRNDANLELLKESESSFQVLTSAIVVLPAIFLLQRTDKDVSQLTGKGELILNEAGIRVSNSAENVERALDWKYLYASLQKQNRELAGEYGTQEALEGALGVEFERNAVYLVAEKDFLEPLDGEQKICQTLAEKFPELTQIVRDDDEEGERVTQYLLPDLNIGALNQYIRNIYSSIEEITQTSAWRAHETT